MQDHKTLLRQHGLKATTGRIRLLASLNAASQPLSIQNILARLSKNTDKTTVYRNLKSLQTLGVVAQVDFRHGHAHYELASKTHHHHLVCTNCGKVEDITGQEIEKSLKQVIKKSRQFAVIKNHSLELFGLCKKCVRL